METRWMPPIEAIERIEVIRGPMSTLYGSEAMGGVINVITRKVGDKWTGAFSTSSTIRQGSGGDALAGDIYLTGPIIPGKLGVRIEDVIILGEDGCEDITLAPKELIIL